MSEAPKSFQEIMEEYNRENNIPIDVSDSITHSEFVSGARAGVVGFKVMGGEAYQLTRGLRKSIFNILVLLYLVSPFILIPLWAWHEENWWLLLGIVVAFVATRFAANHTYHRMKQTAIGAILAGAAAYFLLSKGIHNYYPFFIVSALWGYGLFVLADRAQNRFAMKTLIENPEVFRRAIVAKRIMIVRQRES
jgi:hypothetical protein